MDPLDFSNSILDNINDIFDTNRNIRQANDIRRLRQLLEEQGSGRNNNEAIVAALANLPEGKRNQIFNGITDPEAIKYDALATISELYKKKALTKKAYETEKKRILAGETYNLDAYKRLSQIVKLHEDGVLSDEEYAEERKNIFPHKIKVYFKMPESLAIRFKCYLYNRDENELIWQGKLDEVAEIECTEPIKLRAKVKTLFSKADFDAQPGDSFTIISSNMSVKGCVKG